MKIPTGDVDGIGKDLARTIRRMYERGLISGVGGNASALLASKDQILITPAGYFKGGVAAGDLVRVGLDGKSLGRGRPSSELPTHLEAYAARKDVGAVVHAHPPTAIALITAGVEIPTLTPEHAVMIRKVSVVGFVPPGAEGAKAVRPLLGDADVVGIANHGFFSLGRDLHEAASKLEVLEESARIYLAGKQVGGVDGLNEGQLRKVRAAYGLE